MERLITLTRSLLTLAKFTGDKPPLTSCRSPWNLLIHDLVDELTILADDVGSHWRWKANGRPSSWQEAPTWVHDRALIAEVMNAHEAFLIRCS